MKIIMSLLFVMLHLYSFSQDRQVKEAIKKGVNKEGLYEAFIEANEMLTPKKQEKWCKKNNIVVKERKFSEILKFGDYEQVVTWFSFIPSSEENNYASLQLQKQEIAAIDGAFSYSWPIKEKKIRDAYYAYPQHRDYIEDKALNYFGAVEYLQHFPNGKYVEKAKEYVRLKAEGKIKPSFGDWYANAFLQATQQQVDNVKDAIKNPTPLSEETERLYEGNISVPNYKTEPMRYVGVTLTGRERYHEQVVNFDDYVKGTLFWNEKRNKYFISHGLSIDEYYQNYEAAIKALYIYKKYRVITNAGRD